MRKGGSCKGVYGSHRRLFSRPLASPLRASKTTRLAACGEERSGEGPSQTTSDVKGWGSTPQHQQYTRGGGPLGARSSLSQLCLLLGTWALHPGDLPYLAHGPCSAPVCLPADRVRSLIHIVRVTLCVNVCPMLQSSECLNAAVFLFSHSLISAQHLMLSSQNPL